MKVRIYGHRFDVDVDETTSPPTLVNRFGTSAMALVIVDHVARQLGGYVIYQGEIYNHEGKQIFPHS